MSRARPKGLIFFVLIGLVGVGALVGLGLLLRRGGGDSADETARSGSGAPAVFKGTGTTWMEDELAGDATAVVEGVVLDAEGRPVDGARVTLSRARGRNEEGGSPFAVFQPRGMAVSAGAGRFRIDRLASGDYTASAMADGWEPAQKALTLADKQTARVELRLKAGGLVLDGRVLDIGGGVIGGAKVSAYGRGLNPGKTPVLFHVLSDGEGRYRMTLAKGSYGLRAEAEGYAGTMDEALVMRPTTKDLRLVPAARLAGQVLERASGQPVPHAEVTLTSALRTDSKPTRDTRADDNGRFEFSALEPGRYEVMGRKGPLVGAAEVVGVAVAQTVDGIEVRVDAGYTITGRVKDEQGKGMGNIRVSASRDSPPWGQAARTRTNADGTYALEGMLPGAYRLSAGEIGLGDGRAAAKVLASNVNNVDIVIPVPTKVHGRVLTASGQPVEGARVGGSFEGSTGGSGMMSIGVAAVSDADGRFELMRTMAGTMRLSARHDEHGSAHIGPEPLKAGETKTVEFRLKPGASISGVVRTEDGKPAPGVRVSAFARELRAPMDAQDVTGPDGRYRLVGLLAARMTVQADRSPRPSFGPDDSPSRKTVPLGEAEHLTGVDLVVGPAGLAIKGMTVSPDGKPVPGAIVVAALERGGRASRGMARDLKAYSDLEGNFSLSDLERGAYTVWATHPEHPEAEAKGVSPGQGVVRLQFPASASVAGVVVLADGKPVQHYTISILPGPAPGEKPDDRRRRQMNSFDLPTQRVQHPQGAFELRQLTGGAHELVVNSADGASASQVVTVQAGEKRTGIRIQLAPGVRVTGRVLEHGSNRPMAAVGVSVMGAGTARVATDTGADGSFVLEGAPASEMVRLHVSPDREKYIPESKELDIKPGQTAIDAGTIKLLPGDQRQQFDLQPGERGLVGLNYKREGNRVLLRGVTPDRPAARAGLKEGDILLAIDGKDVADLGNGALGFLLTGKTGTTVAVTAASPGASPRTVTLTREAAPPPRPPSPSASR